MTAQERLEAAVDFINRAKTVIDGQVVVNADQVIGILLGQEVGA